MLKGRRLETKKEVIDYCRRTGRKIIYCNKYGECRHKPRFLLYSQGHDYIGTMIEEGEIYESVDESGTKAA